MTLTPQLRFLQSILDFRPESVPSSSPAALADAMYQLLHQVEPHTKEKVPPVFGLGHIWVYHPSTSVWIKVHPEELRALIQNWDGVWIDGEEKTLRISDDKKIVDMLLARCARNLAYGKDRDGDDWIASGEGGVAFSDSFLRVEEVDHRLVIKNTTPHHQDRTMAGFDIDCPAIPAIPHDISNEQWVATMLQYLKDAGSEYLHLYLSTVWKNNPDEAANIRFLAQFAGVALFGKATNQRFMRALVLQGPPGTGKSTFIKMLAGLFPQGATSSVHPQVFTESDKISSMAGSRFNFVEELDKAPIRSDSVLREIISGARVQVRDPYVKNYFFSSAAAHLWGCNELPNIPGADRATWRRLAILRLSNLVRDTDKEIHDIEKIIADKERHLLISWAIAGAVDAFAHNRYLIPASAEDHLKEWSQEADSVSVFITEECADETRQPLLVAETRDAIKLTDLYKCYAHWARESGHTPVSKSVFKVRIQSQSIEIRKRSVDVAMVKLNDQGNERHAKIASME